MAVVKFAISNPGTTMLAPHKRRTFIKNAVKPKVIIDRGSAINWTSGFMKELTTPITTAATMAAR